MVWSSLLMVKVAALTIFGSFSTVIFFSVSPRRNVSGTAQQPQWCSKHNNQARGVCCESAANTGVHGYWETANVCTNPSQRESSNAWATLAAVYG